MSKYELPTKDFTINYKGKAYTLSYQSFAHGATLALFMSAPGWGNAFGPINKNFPGIGPFETALDTNNYGMEIQASLIEAGIIEEEFYSHRSGFCQYPTHEFTEEFMQEINGYLNYLEDFIRPRNKAGMEEIEEQKKQQERVKATAFDPGI